MCDTQMSSKSTIRIPFASDKDADIAKQVIEVDRELQPDVVKRTISVEGTELVAYGTHIFLDYDDKMLTSILQDLHNIDRPAGAANNKRLPGERRPGRTDDRGVRRGCTTRVSTTPRFELN